MRNLFPSHNAESKKEISYAAMKLIYSCFRIVALLFESMPFRNPVDARFLKVPKLFGPNSGATIPFISSQCRASKPSNFAILLVFLTLKTC